MSRPVRALLLGLVFLTGGMLSTDQATAQLLHLDPLPFSAPADSTARLALVVGADRCEDSHTGWSANRLLITAFFPAGSSASFFVRMPYVTFDNGGMAVLDRWPWLKNEDAETGWPAVQRRSSLGQPELGLTGPIGLPVLGGCDFGAALGFPAGSDYLYPFSSASIPLRLELRRPFTFGARLHAALAYGYLRGMGSGKDHLESDEAFPSGKHLGSMLGWRLGARSRISLSYDFQERVGRRSKEVRLDLWVPWTPGSSVGLHFSRELQGTLDRGAAWRAGISFRFDAKQSPS